MAEKSDELTSFDRIDPAASTRRALESSALEKYPEDVPVSASEKRETRESTDEVPEETEHLKAQIEETRHQMGETIDAIQEKLSFSNISEQVSEQLNNAIETAKHTVYDATIGKAVNYMKDMGSDISGSTAVKMVRNNPLPFVLIAAGAGLLAYNSYSSGKGRSNERRTPRQDAPGNEPTSGARSLLGSAREKAGGIAESVGSAAGSAYESVAGAASGTYAGIANSASNAYTGANELVHRAYDKVGEYGVTAQDQYNHHIEENPLAVGAVALALGAAIGFAIPSTRYEGELMGEARENLMQKAQDSAGLLVDKVREVASEAGETLKSEIGDKGIIH
jgi:ElaB/YqjD/DUF883 family membrane-anchored ribosome-binding protein